MMRKISLLIYPLLLLCLLACEDQLDQAPVSEMGSNNFYRNEKDFQQAVNGIYAQLRHYPDHQYFLSEIRSDNIYGATEQGVRDHEPINNFDNTIQVNPFLVSAWNDHFNGIMRANTVLDKLSPEVVHDDELRARFEGESKFLRAFYYFELVRWFGQVPLYDRFITPEEALEVPRSPVADVYELIVSDLEDAIALLPQNYDAAHSGRATAWAAKGLLARVHLTRSGPDYGVEGPGLGVNAYAEAVTLLDDIINNGPFSWVEDYASIFDYNNENNPDIIFDIQYQSGGLGVGALYPGLMVPEAYFRAIGMPFPPGGFEVNPISDDYMNSFEEADVRRAVTIQEGYTDENGFVDPRPFYKKFLDLNKHGIDRFDWPINFPLIRYTDVLLMKAEAILQGGPGSQADVDNIVNKVRERAGIDPVSNVTLQMLMEERRREFGAEGLRWHDLVRSGLIINQINDWIPEADIHSRMNSMVPEYVIYPIPFTQLLIKEGLYQQNKGYR
jgi:hypothetical protein